MLAGHIFCSPRHSVDVGMFVGLSEGGEDGAKVGTKDGNAVGVSVGNVVGVDVGDEVAEQLVWPLLGVPQLMV